MKYEYFVEHVRSNIYCMILPFFPCSNIEMMEVIWTDNINTYSIDNIFYYQRGPRNYFRSLKYGRDYCKRTYIDLRKPFNANEKSVQMDLVLCSLLTLLNHSKAELVYEAVGAKYDTYFISICFGSTFLIYKYHIYQPKYMAKFHGARNWRNFIDEVGYCSEYKEIYHEANKIIQEFYSHF